MDLRDELPDLYEISKGNSGEYISRVLNGEEESVGRPIDAFSGPRLWLEPAGDYDYIAHVGGPILADSAPTTKDFSYEKVIGSGIYAHTEYEVAHGLVLWSFNEAVGFLSRTQVQKLPTTSSPPNVSVMRNSDWEYTKRLWVPGYGSTAEDWRRFFQGEGFEASTIENLVTNEMNKMRMRGLPLPDDPLRHLVIIQEGESGPIDIEQLVSNVQAEKNGPRTNAEAEDLREQKTKEHRRAEEAKRLLGNLAVVTGNTSVWELIKEKAGDGWLEKELTAYEEEFNIEF